jgi:hypothetical protein
MKNSHNHISPSTLTHNAQARILQRHVLAFIKAQKKATEALEAINAIALCESDGNPLPLALTGTGLVLSYARNGQKEFCGESDEGYRKITEEEEELVNLLLTRATNALNASGYWASND